MKPPLRLLLTCAVLLGSVASSAFATLIDPNAQFQMAGFGTITLKDGSNLTTTNLFNAATASIPTVRVTGVPDTYDGDPNDFCNSGDCAVTGNGAGPIYSFDTVSAWNYTNSIFSTTWSLDLTFGNLPIIEFSSTSSPANRYVFTANSYDAAESTSGAAKFVNIYFLGTMTDAGNTFNTIANNASLSLTLTQATAGANPALSGSFATPPEPNFIVHETPEPGTWGLMAVGLLGFGYTRFRRQRA